jgi:hypothetical protein
VIGNGSGHIPKDAIVADGLIRVSSISATVIPVHVMIIAIRHLGCGRMVYQPVIFEGALPVDERSAAALFALAAKDPEPIPVVTKMGLLRLRQGGALSQRVTAAAASS